MGEESYKIKVYNNFMIPVPPSELQLYDVKNESGSAYKNFYKLDFSEVCDMILSERWCFLLSFPLTYPDDMWKSRCCHYPLRNFWNSTAIP